MVKIIKEELLFEKSLKKKIEFICDFCNTTPKFINGTLRVLTNTISQDGLLSENLI